MLPVALSPRVLRITAVLLWAAAVAVPFAGIAWRTQTWQDAQEADTRRARPALEVVAVPEGSPIAITIRAVTPEELQLVELADPQARLEQATMRLGSDDDTQAILIDDEPSQRRTVTSGVLATYCNYLSQLEGLTPCYISADANTMNVFGDCSGYRLPTTQELAVLADEDAKQAVHLDAQTADAVGTRKLPAGTASGGQSVDTQTTVFRTAVVAPESGAARVFVVRQASEAERQALREEAQAASDASAAETSASPADGKRDK